MSSKQESVPSSSVDQGLTGSQIDEVLERAKVEDPVIRAFAEYWRQILFAAVVVGLGYYIYSGYQQTQDKSLKRAADLTHKVRTALADYTALKSKSVANGEAAVNQEEITKQEQLVTQRLNALSDITKSPYREIATLYQSLFDIRKGQLGEARNGLDGAVGDLDQKISTLKGEEKLLLELQALLLARVLVDQDVTYIEGRRLLRVLTEKGDFVMASAARSLARISISTEERSEALSALQGIVARSPEQLADLEEDIKRLKL